MQSRAIQKFNGFPPNPNTIVTFNSAGLPTAGGAKIVHGEYREYEYVKLYRSYRHKGSWVAYSLETGWVIFPETENGWEVEMAQWSWIRCTCAKCRWRMAANTGMHVEVEKR